MASKVIYYKQLTDTSFQVSSPDPETTVRFDLNTISFEDCLDTWGFVEECLTVQREKERLSFIGYEQSKAKRIALQELCGLLAIKQEELAPMVVVYLRQDPAIYMTIRRETLPDIMNTGLWSLSPEIITVLEPEPVYRLAA